MKPDRDLIERTLRQLGDAERAIAIVHEDENSWVARAPQDDVRIEYEQELRQIRLWTVLGTVPAERRAELYERFLAYNMLWRDTGGVRLALLLPGGPAIQSAVLHIDALTAETLASTVKTLIERTGSWRDYIKGDDPAPEPPPPTDAHIIPM
jgi:hypothetical protein